MRRAERKGGRKKRRGDAGTRRRGDAEKKQDENSSSRRVAASPTLRVSSSPFPHTRDSSGKRRPTVSIVGAGRLGTALGIALKSGGYSIKAVVARHLNHARRSARLIGPNAQALTSKQLNLLPASDILLITTPDDEIEAVAKTLATVLSKDEDGARTALHASGALSSSILRSLSEVGFRIGSMHPLIAVSDAVSGAETLHEAFFCLEGERHALRVARQISRALGAKSFS
ncbi:MAG: hypothetical protein AUG51_04870 [Acidobacteria bacterium 13_1_20CM_3_53_8]|nr:MAG: hypothetical protein AUG51_04870 [Acidobacteria bacterium 13_1_20CM_3_53_8]